MLKAVLIGGMFGLLIGTGMLHFQFSQIMARSSTQRKLGLKVKITWNIPGMINMVVLCTVLGGCLGAIVSVFI